MAHNRASIPLFVCLSETRISEITVAQITPVLLHFLDASWSWPHLLPRFPPFYLQKFYHSSENTLRVFCQKNFSIFINYLNYLNYKFSTNTAWHFTDFLLHWNFFIFSTVNSIARSIYFLSSVSILPISLFIFYYWIKKTTVTVTRCTLGTGSN